jgi:hypothetical protein
MKHFSMNDFNFPVEQQPIHDQLGNIIAGHQAVVRTDTDQVLGVHGSRYKIVSHDDVVNSVLDGVKSADLSNDYEVSVDVLEDGRKLRGEILFNNLTVEPAVGDYIKFRVSFFNSYDASWSFSQQANGLRLWCLNGCTTPDTVARSRYKHTASINVEGAAAKVINGLEHFKSRKDVWQSWMQTKLEQQQVENFFKKTVCKAFTRQQSVTKTNEKQLENLLSIWSDERSSLGSNKWALYNCLTYWATHTQDLRKPEIAKYNRELQIAGAMKSKQWGEMV